MLLNPFRFAGGAEAEFLVDSADFDGSNDVLIRAGLVGAADSKLLSFVYWLRLDAQPTTNWMVITNGNVEHSYIRVDTTKLDIRVEDTAGATRLRLLSKAIGTNAWRCIMGSFDMADAAKRHLYIGDVESLETVTTYTNATLDFTYTESTVGGRAPSGNKFNGQMAEIWYAPGQYIDFSVQANRRKFYSSIGKPVNLGADGSTPTGTAPLVYLHLDNVEAPANFAVNAGSGGNYTITGSLSTGATSPSD